MFLNTYTITNTIINIELVKFILNLNSNKSLNQKKNKYLQKF